MVVSDTYFLELKVSSKDYFKDKATMKISDSSQKARSATKESNHLLFEK